MSDPAPPITDAEFDRKLEAERARWLRRRFLWLCGVVGVLNLLLAPFVLLASFIDMSQPGSAKSFRGPMWLHQAEVLVGFVLTLALFLYVLIRPPRRQAMLWLAEFVVITGGAMTLAVEWAGHHFDDSFNVYDWVTAASVVILMNHLPACLFLPWTPRESLRPGLALIGLSAFVLAVHVPRGGEATVAITSIALSPLLLFPGLFVCWSRQSRFRSRFRLLFESEAYRKLQAELTSARRIHDLCLPKPLLDGPVCLQFAYAPMREIGGDLLFVPHACAQAQDGRVSVVLLDVTGHGVGAALTVNRLVGELERVFGESADASPRDVLCALNRYVHLTLARHGVFVSALCVRADAVRGVVQWANGGHPTAFLRRAGGGLEDITSTGMLLGAVDAHEYCPDEVECPFAPGDAVVAYTDGASEARDADGNQLCTDGLRRLVTAVADDGTPPTAWPSSVMRRVASHRDEGPEDDILILTLFRPAHVPGPTPVERGAALPRSEVAQRVAAGRA